MSCVKKKKPETKRKRLSEKKHIQCQRERIESEKVLNESRRESLNLTSVCGMDKKKHKTEQG